MGSKEYYQKNKEKIKAKAREYYESHKEKLKETSRKWYLANREKRIEQSKANRPKYRAKKNEYSKRVWREQRIALINQVSNGSNKCLRCGFSDIRALQIDHVNGGGRAEVRNTKFRNPYRYGKHIAKNPEDYQVLCANCNWIKRDENKEYKKV
ncbi:MAG: hypothetical protein IFNCLDLE_02639 [Ignavibacteriaceae bacterium]|nr:hypothetical protein [Ignavibacteriaceae bacterium]